MVVPEPIRIREQSSYPSGRTRRRDTQPIPLHSSQEDKESLFLSALEEDMRTHLNGRKLASGMFQQVVDETFQGRVWELIHTLGTSYPIDMVPNEERTKTTHMVLEGRSSEDGTIPAVVGEVVEDSQGQGQGVSFVHFRKIIEE